MHKFRGSSILLFNLIFVLTLLFIPPNVLSLRLDFKIHYIDRMNVIDIIKNKFESSPEKTVMFQLPKTYQNLSKGGGEVLVLTNKNKLNVLFFISRGISDNVIGFLYSSEKDFPSQEVATVNFHLVKKLQDHWFIIESY